MSFKMNTFSFKMSTLEVKVQLAPLRVKSKMVALTPKLSVRYMVTALYIQVNFNERQAQMWNWKHTNKNPWFWAMALDHELANTPIFIP